MALPTLNSLMWCTENMMNYDENKCKMLVLLNLIEALTYLTFMNLLIQSKLIMVCFINITDDITIASSEIMLVRLTGWFKALQSNVLT